MIAGVYGMNFEHMPELKWQYGYPLTVGVMVVLDALPLLALPQSGLDLTRVEINSGRYWRSVERSAEIGRGRPGGLARVALSDSDREMRDQFVTWCRDAGCTIAIDGVGNIFARRKGTDDSLPPVVMGSHLDTQVNGGRYDGIVGVLAGLEVLRTLNEKNIQTRRAIEVVNWTNEEGARFSPPMIAAGAFAGVYAVDWVLDRRDDEGRRFGDELARIGYAGAAPVGGRQLDSYFELHIEQGPLLDAKRIDVGVVTHGYTAHGFIVEVKGETAHTGPWPMDKRRNALVGAAMLAVAAHEIGWKYHATQGKGTAARIVAWPNKPGILSDWAQFTGDLRHEDPRMAAQMRSEFEEIMKSCAKARQRRDEDRRPVDLERGAFRPGMHRAGARYRAAAGARLARPALAGRPRRLSRSARRPHRDDLLALQGRHHPQQQRARRSRAHGAGGQRPRQRGPRQSQQIIEVRARSS